MTASSLIGHEGKRFAFELSPEVFGKLKRHSKFNHTFNLEAIPFALSARQ